MPTRLSSADKLRLMAFLCSFAWADLQVREAERSFVRSIAKRLELSEDESEKVEEWLRVPPPAELVDPAGIPMAQRALVLEMARAMIAADGEIAGKEQENLSLLEALLR